MLIDVNKLESAALDWAVAKSLYGDRVVHYKTWLETENKYWKGSDCSFASNLEFRILSEDRDGVTTAFIKPYSTDWAQGGPIIEREGITAALCSGDLGEPSRYWIATIETHSWDYAYGPYHEQDEDKSLYISKPDVAKGPTPLIAAMRCFVAAKLGDETEIPEELVNASI